MTPEEIKAMEDIRTATLAAMAASKTEHAKALGDLSTALIARIDEQKTKGSIDPETKEKIDRLFARLDKLELDSTRPGSAASVSTEGKSAGEQVISSETFQAAQKLQWLGQTKVPFAVKGCLPQIEIPGRKSAITTVGVGTGTSGVQMPQRLPGITGLARQALRIRDLLTVRPLTTGNSFDWVKELARTNNASPQIESTTKAESTYTYTVQSGSVKTVAHFINVSRQALDDIDWLRGNIDSNLIYGLKVKEESEILAGDGLGQHLSGLVTQASAYNTALHVAADTRLDQLRHAILQARLAGLDTYAPDGIVLHPTDMEKIELIKVDQSGANTGLYILGDPKTGTQIKFVWGLPVVESDSMSVGQFLVGGFSTAAELVDRMAATVLISFEHGTNFTDNMATILCEERLGLPVRRPDAFIQGTFV